MIDPFGAAAICPPAARVDEQQPAARASSQSQSQSQSGGLSLSLSLSPVRRRRRPVSQPNVTTPFLGGDGVSARHVMCAVDLIWLVGVLSDDVLGDTQCIRPACNHSLPSPCPHSPPLLPLMFDG